MVKKKHQPEQITMPWLDAARLEEMAVTVAAMVGGSVTGSRYGRNRLTATETGLVSRFLGWRRVLLGQQLLLENGKVLSLLHSNHRLLQLVHDLV
jgi:hypothetical protein